MVSTLNVKGVHILGVEMISQSRWDWVLREVERLVRIAMSEELTELEVEELELVSNTLRNNTPFQVVPDCVSDVVLKTNDVLIETKHFKVLGNEND